MKVVYVAGPYRASGEWQVTQNIRRAEEYALAVWKMGAACICPHKNTAYFGGAADDQVWLSGDLEILRRCDAILCMPEWQSSQGSRDEISEALERGIPVFYDLRGLEIWLRFPVENQS